MTTVIDFASGPPSAASIKAAGHEGVVLYISDAREDWMTGKNPSREYLDSLDAHGVKFAFVYQFRKGGTMSAGDAGRGYGGGYEDAGIALRRLNGLQCSGHPVFFAVDWDVTTDEWNSNVVNYFRGAIAKIGQERVGIYGHSRVVHWAMEDDVVAEVAPGRVLGWVAGPRSWGSWDGDQKRGRDYAVLFQHPTGLPGPDGVEIDENEPFHPEWGWRAVADRRTEAPRPDLHPVEYPCDMVIDTPDSGWRDPHKTQASVFHTTENGDSTPPENVANWQTDPANGSSYNVLCGADATGAKTVRGNPDNRRPWSAGEPGNTYANHFSNIGWAARSRADWFNNPMQLERNAEWAADEHLRYGRPLVWLEPEDLAAGKKGFTSHGNWFHGKGGPAYRSDPGDGFPHDWVLTRAREITSTDQKEGFLMSLTTEEQQELLTLARSSSKRVEALEDQIMGPEQHKLAESDRNPKGGRGWRQLGANAFGYWLTLVDGVAALREDVAALTALVKEKEKKK